MPSKKKAARKQVPITLAFTMKWAASDCFATITDAYDIIW